MKVIDSVVESQKRQAKLNMVSDKDSRKKLERLLFIYDDVVGDSQLKSHSSALASFSCMSRHSKITNIYLV